jgi:hypothetical protein
VRLAGPRAGAATPRESLHQPRQPEFGRLPPVQDRLDDVRREQRELQHTAEIAAVDALGAAISLMDAYRPSSSRRWYRNARASAFTNAGLARVQADAGPATPPGVTIVFRPGRRRIASGTRTVMLVACVMRRPAAPRARWR